MLSMHELSLSMPEPMLSLSMPILATYPVADIRPRSKPKSKLTSPNFNIMAFVLFEKFGAPLSTGGLGSPRVGIFGALPNGCSCPPVAVNRPLRHS